jgi:hypothetical protein
VALVAYACKLPVERVQALVAYACKLPVERVLDGLSEAAALGVVTEEERAAGLYRFSHSLIREVLYERLPIPARTPAALAHW